MCKIKAVQKTAITLNAPVLVQSLKLSNFNRISQFWPNISILTRFQNFDQISEFWPSFTILTKFQNFSLDRYKHKSKYKDNYRAHTIHICSKNPNTKTECCSKFEWYFGRICTLSSSQSSRRRGERNMKLRTKYKYKYK